MYRDEKEEKDEEWVGNERWQLARSQRAIPPEFCRGLPLDPKTFTPWSDNFLTFPTFGDLGGMQNFAVRQRAQSASILVQQSRFQLKSSLHLHCQIHIALLHELDYTWFHIWTLSCTGWSLHWRLLWFAVRQHSSISDAGSKLNGQVISGRTVSSIQNSICLKKYSVGEIDQLKEI